MGDAYQVLVQVFCTVVKQTITCADFGRISFGITTNDRKGATACVIYATSIVP